MKDTTEKALFNRIASNDTFAFRQLYDKYFPILRFNATKILKSALWSEEVSQEVFLYIWENRKQLATIENPKAWLFRIASNKCLDRIRRQGVEIRAQYIIYNSLHEEPNWRHDYNLVRQLIAEAVHQLPEQQRQAYCLQQEELSYKEIAERLGISPNTVRNHLVRAFAAIRQHLVNHGIPLFIIFFHLK